MNFEKLPLGDFFVTITKIDPPLKGNFRHDAFTKLKNHQ